MTGKILIGKKPYYEAGEGYLYQFIDIDTGEITEEDEQSNIINRRKVELIRKGMKTEFGTVVIKAGGKVYFDTKKYASTAIVNRYILQKGIFPKFPSFKSPKPPKIEAPQPSETTQTAQESQTSANPATNTPKPEITPPTATAPNNSNNSSSSQAIQPKYQPGQERPGHKYIKRVPDPKNPGKFIYFYQEDIDAENSRYKFEDEQGKEVKTPEYDRKFHEAQYKDDPNWKPVKRNILDKLGDKIAGQGKTYEHDLGNGRKIEANHDRFSPEGNYYFIDEKNNAHIISSGQEMLRALEDSQKKKDPNIYVPVTENEIITATIWDREKGDRAKGIVLFNPKTKKYRYVEGNAHEAGMRDRVEPNPAADWIESAWEYERKTKTQVDYGDKPTASTAKTQEQSTTEEPKSVEPEQVNQTQTEAYEQQFSIGETYKINGFEGELTAKQGRVGILKDRDGNMKLFKLEQFEVQPYTESSVEGESNPDTEQMPEFKTYKEYQQYADAKRRLKNEHLFSRFKAGGFKTRKTAKQLEEEEQAAAEKERIRQESIAKNREILESDSYKDGRGKIEEKGYKIDTNQFHASKKIRVRNFEFALSAQYDTAEGKWKTRFHDAPYTTVEIDGQKYGIDDMNDKGVFYRAVEMPDIQLDMFGGEEENQSVEPREVKKFISYDELEEKNGKRMFEKTPATKGIISRYDAEDVLFPDDESEKATWEVIELFDLILSHNQDGSKNPNYSNKEAQSRDRSDKKTQAQITKFATDLDFKKYRPDTSLWSHDGAPVVDQDYETVSGNGRGMGIQRHYEMGGKKYKEELIKNADRFGFDPQDIQKMEQPVIVRRLNVDKDRAIRLGVLGNKDQKLAQSDTEEAVAYSKLITPKAARLLGGELENTIRRMKDKYVGSGGEEDKFNPTFNEVLEKSGYEVFRILLDQGVIAENEVSKFYDSKNENMSPDNRKRVTDILTHYLLGQQAAENWDSAYDKTRSGVQQSLGTILLLKDSEFDISKEVAQVISLQGSYRRINEARKEIGQSAMPPEAFIAEQQIQMFGEEGITPEVESMFSAFYDASQNQIRNMINRYRQKCEGDIFDSANLDKSQIIEEVFKKKVD